jgi:hypothetical protein
MEKPIEEYKILTARHSSELVTQVKALMSDGWRTVGSHQVVTTHIQNRYSGMQFKDAVYQTEYSQTIVRP